MSFNPSIQSECEAISLSLNADSDRSKNQEFSEKGGINNIRPDLKIDAIVFSPDSFKPSFSEVSEEEKVYVFWDWLRFNGCFKTEEQWRKLVMILFPGQGQEFWVNKEANYKPHPGHKGFPCACIGELGTRLSWRKETTPDGQILRYWEMILPGKALEPLGLVGTVKLLERLIAICPAINPTRFDFTVEDHQKRLNPSQVIDALSRKNYTGFKAKDVILSDSKGDGWDGFTVNLGSRESDSYTRIYETTVKHGYPAIRVERELKGQLLKATWEDLKKLIYEKRWVIKGTNEPLKQEFYARLTQLIGAIAVNGVNFIDRSNQYSNGSLENCKPLEWWQEFKASFGEWSKSIPRPKPTLKSLHDWLYRQVKKTLAIFKHGLTECDYQDILERLVNHATPDLTDKDKMMITILRNKGIYALMETMQETSINEVEHEPIPLPEGLLACVPY